MISERRRSNPLDKPITGEATAQPDYKHAENMGIQRPLMERLREHKTPMKVRVGAAITWGFMAGAAATYTQPSPDASPIEELISSNSQKAINAIKSTKIDTSNKRLIGGVGAAILGIGWASRRKYRPERTPNPLVEAIPPNEALSVEDNKYIVSRVGNIANALSEAETAKVREATGEEIAPNEYATKYPQDILALIDQLPMDDTTLYPRDHRRFLQREIERWMASINFQKHNVRLDKEVLYRISHYRYPSDVSKDDSAYHYHVKADLVDKGTSSNIREAMREEVEGPKPTKWDLLAPEDTTDEGIMEARRQTGARLIYKTPYASEGAYLLSVKTLEKAEADYKHDSDFQYEYGLTLVRAGGEEHVKKGIELLEQATSSQETKPEDDRNEMWHIGLAEAYGRAGRYADAMQEYKIASSINSENELLSFLENGPADTKTAWKLHYEAKKAAKAGNQLQALLKHEQAIALGGEKTLALSLRERSTLLAEREVQLEQFVVFQKDRADQSGK